MRHAGRVPDDRSPWADPESAHVIIPPAPTAPIAVRASEPIHVRPHERQLVGAGARSTSFGAGNVTGVPIEAPARPEPAAPPSEPPVDRSKRTMRMFGGGALA